jgi:hypothetical protein
LTTRTLIIGLALPNVAFDNATFLSAPSFSEYSRIVVDVSSVAKCVQDVVDGSGAAATFGGQAVVNGPASAYAFPLEELLIMRKRETEWLLRGGGLVVLIGHPLVSIPGVAGLTAWSSYTWLPEPEGATYSELLKPGFGKEGAVLTDVDHPFAPIVSELATRVGYRIAVDESIPSFPEVAHTFARSPGGAAIGVQLKAGGGTVVILPAINNPERDRQQIAAAFVEALSRWDASRGTTSNQVARGVN